MRHLRPLTSLAPLLALLAAVTPLGTVAAAEINVAAHVANRTASAPLIEIAILLDTSSSMDGLIDQARTRLWAIVNDLSKTTRDGKVPDLRVALYEYGNSGLSQPSNYIRQVMPLSDDLDGISAALFALRTNGGEEYCGAVIKEAVEHLKWEPSEHYRAIFIAGNEPFTQGGVSYVDACKEAIAKGVTVNTIHCGAVADGVNGKWVDGARLADGDSMNIDQNRQEVAIAAPQDARISELNTQLNGTYVGYGAQGHVLKMRQADQDAAAAPSSAAFGQRAAAKAGSSYRNSAWDVVDAAKDGSVDVAKMSDEELPVEMKGMDVEQRTAFIAGKATQRAALQAEIGKLAVEREAFVAAERAKLGDHDDGFGAAVRGVLKKQLAAKGYQTK